MAARAADAGGNREMRMRGSSEQNVDRNRRRLVGGAVLAGLLSACGGSGDDGQDAAGPSSTPPPTPGAQPGGTTRISLAESGGVPGASPEVLRNAFARSFSQLVASGGGELLVPSGVYDFGSYSTDADIVSAENLRNVRINAHGAHFVATSAADVTPYLLRFKNPENVVIAGARFSDLGYDPQVNWRGMHCVRVEATRASSGFAMIDCQAENVVSLFYSDQTSNRFLLTDVDIQGRLKNAYYGVDTLYVGDNVKVNLRCEDVRRGFISFGARNADVDIQLTCNNEFEGSNGFVALICEGASAGDVENVSVRLDISGAVSHRGLVHFYHQQSEGLGAMRNIDARISANNLRSGRRAVRVDAFIFDHELPNGRILSTTTREWDRIFLHSSGVGSMPGRLISNPSVSTGTGGIFISRSLAPLIDLSGLPNYFRISPS